MPLYTITFDLEDAGPDKYEGIYEWAHKNGGYHYLEKTLPGCWGRLPSTTIALEHSENRIPDFTKWFRDTVEIKFSVVIKNLMVVNGPFYGESTPSLRSDDLPSYVEQSPKEKGYYSSLFS